MKAFGIAVLLGLLAAGNATAAALPAPDAELFKAAVGKIDTWLYGSQFDDRPVCYTTGLDLKGSYNQRYFCLCVAKQ